MLAEADESLWRRESVATTLDGAPPFILLVEQFCDRAARVRIKGDRPLTALADDDDGVALRVHAWRQLSRWRDAPLLEQTIQLRQ